MSDRAALAEIEGLKFQRRLLSWTAVRGGFHYKIPRGRLDSGPERPSKGAYEEAKAEHEHLLFLATLSDAVIRPVAFIEEKACIVTPLIDGAGMRELLLAGRAGESINKTMTALARLHTRSAEQIESVSQKPYPFPVPSDVRRVVVIEGFEVRNILVRAKSSDIVLLDPHKVWAGLAEDDISRFVLSLLMLNWGRNANPRCWRQFSLPSMLAAYETATQSPLDHGRLKACFRENLAMRRGYALEAISRMPLWIRPLAWVYKRLYFRQIEAWRDAVGL